MAHPYMPNSTAKIKAQMMQAVGISGIDRLFEQIPSEHLTSKPFDLGRGIHAEATLQRQVGDLLARNGDCRRNRNFLGAGCWQHYVPAVCDEIAGRSEFLTPVSGTPSSDFGRNQAWFEFASQLGELVGMEFVGLPVYSWGAAAGHALRMAVRMTERREVIVPRILDPERRAVIGTLCGPSITIIPVGYDAASGRVDLTDLRAKISASTAAVYLETPNYLGVIEDDVAEIAALARRHGAETIAGVDPISLGVIAAPGGYGADIAVGSTQPLGVHMNAGGGIGGFIATRDEERYACQYPTLQVSLCDTVEPGQRSFGKTLFHQNSYGSREEGNDWTGTSVYLWAVVNAVYMALLGPQGFAEIGTTIAANSAYAARRVADVPGVRVRWPSGFFKEFAVDFTQTGRSVAAINTSLRHDGIFGGKGLCAEYPEFGESALYCVTEIHTAEDISALVAGLEKAVRQ